MTTDADLRLLEAARLLAVIEGLESLLSPREQSFLRQMRTATRVSEKQVRWLRDLREKVLD